MAAPMTTGGYSDLVTNVDIMFQAQLENFHNETSILSLYENQPHSKGDPKKMTFQTTALPTYAQRAGELQNPVKGSATLGNQLEREFFKHSFSYPYTIEMDEFDTERLVDQLAGNLSKQITASEELEAVHQLLTYANSATYTPMGQSVAVDIDTPDGKAVGASDHTVTGTGSTTYSNILADADPLTGGAMTKLISQLQRTTVNDAGKNIIMDIDTLVIPDYFDMEKRAFEILGSNLTPFETSNTHNVFGGGSISDGRGNRKPMKLMVLKRGAISAEGNWDTSKQFYWGVLDSSMQKLSNKVSFGTKAVIKTPPSGDTPALFDVMAYGFMAYGIVYWQGKGYSFSSSL